MQEVAVTVPEPPSRYLLPEKERLGGDELVGAEMPEPVPNIDLRRLLASDDVGAEDEAAKLRSALQNWGFFLVGIFSSSFLSFLQQQSSLTICDSRRYLTRLQTIGSRLL